MSATSTSRIWESPSEPSALNHSSRSAQLPSIATLTNALPGANGAASSPTYGLGSRDRDSDHWPSQPQSTRKSHRTLVFPPSYLSIMINQCPPSESDASSKAYVHIRFLRILLRSEWLLLFLVDQFSPSCVEFQSAWSYFTPGGLPQRSELSWSPAFARIRAAAAQLGSSDTEPVSRSIPVSQQP